MTSSIYTGAVQAVAMRGATRSAPVPRPGSAEYAEAVAAWQGQNPRPSGGWTRRRAPAVGRDQLAARTALALIAEFDARLPVAVRSAVSTNGAAFRAVPGMEDWVQGQLLRRLRYLRGVAVAMLGISEDAAARMSAVEIHAEIMRLAV